MGRVGVSFSGFSCSVGSFRGLYWVCGVVGVIVCFSSCKWVFEGGFFYFLEIIINYLFLCVLVFRDREMESLVFLWKYKAKIGIEFIFISIFFALIVTFFRFFFKILRCFCYVLDS